MYALFTDVNQLIKLPQENMPSFFFFFLLKDSNCSLFNNLILSQPLSHYETAMQNENHSTISDWCIAHLVSSELWKTRHELRIPNWERAQQLFE